MRGLKDKVAIMTGGLGDLGYASAARLAEEGCKVAIFDCLDDEDNRAGDIGCTHFKVDISLEDNVRQACEKVKAELGHVTILVNCAVCFIFKGVEATPEEWQKITSVNLQGASLMAKHVVPQMQEAGGGSIINFSSVSGFVGQSGMATYNATKFAVRGLTRCWAQDLAPQGIRVNSLCPGYFYTSVFVKCCEDRGLDVDEEDKHASAMHLLGRQGRPEELGGAVAFLASDDATFITGSDLLVDGGYLAK